jgi:hypothetical protein
MNPSSFYNYSVYTKYKNKYNILKKQLKMLQIVHSNEVLIKNEKIIIYL